ncbi:hypothetical protein ALQ61_200084 [Pseudomonas coronafaciens pv. zizaniae]|nr:hypothetical protein ALQ61_200084 [Pseudomonas coronafaciens pv. zizaniae]
MKRVTDKFALKAFVLSTVAVIGLQAIAFAATAPRLRLQRNRHSCRTPVNRYQKPCLCKLLRARRAGSKSIRAAMIPGFLALLAVDSAGQKQHAALPLTRA